MNTLPRQRPIWLPIGLILLCGIAIGSGTSMILIKKANAAATTTAAPAPAERTASQITSELRAKIGLSEDQALAVEKLYDTRLRAINSIRAEMIERLSAEHETLRQEMQAALTPAQFAKWDAHFQSLRKKLTHPSPATAPAGALTTLPSVDEVFERFDANGDGKLAQEELPPNVSSRLMRADRNGDKSVTRDELIASRQRIEN